MKMRIEMADLKRQYASIKQQISKSVEKVFAKGEFILGENTKLFEKEFANYCSTKYAAGISSGTDALRLSLLSIGVSPGNEVILPANTAIPTTLAVTSVGAIPVFIDINPETYIIDASLIEKKINKKTRAIIPVHLYGHPANMDEIIKVAKKNNLKIIEDACQAHGTLYKKRKVGSIGDIGCFSFYPSKNLGGCGDGGMIITNSERYYKKIIRLRNYGQASRNRHYEILGENSRLDEIQAAILRVKLKYLDRWNDRRREIAKIYTKSLNKTDLILPVEIKYARHVYHLYVIRSKKRDALRKYLLKKGISTSIHYPIPPYLQVAFRQFKHKKKDFPITHSCAKEILSLPIYPELKEEEIDYIIRCIKKF